MKIDFLNGMKDYVMLKCDRCKELVQAHRYYVKIDGTPSWAKYFLKKEHVLCQDCIRRDKRYIADTENLNALSR